jgi:hypothetical protein
MAKLVTIESGSIVPLPGVSESWYKGIIITDETKLIIDGNDITLIYDDGLTSVMENHQLELTKNSNYKRTTSFQENFNFHYARNTTANLSLMKMTRINILNKLQLQKSGHKKALSYLGSSSPVFGIDRHQRMTNPAAEQRGIVFSRGIGLGFNTFMVAPEGRGIKPSPRINVTLYSKVTPLSAVQYRLQTAGR